MHIFPKILIKLHPANLGEIDKSNFTVAQHSRKNFALNKETWTVYFLQVVYLKNHCKN